MPELNGFDATQVEPVSFDAIPAGDYIAAIVASEEKQTQSGNGTYLKLTLEILEGEFKGRKLFDNLNLNNPNAQAVQIAKGTLSQICRSVNVMQPRQSEELHNKPMVIKVVLLEKAYQGQDKNEVKGYAPAGGAQPTTQPGGARAPVSL